MVKFCLTKNGVMVDVQTVAPHLARQEVYTFAVKS